MATNFQSNIDPAFTRRFNCGIFFPQPDRMECERLWKSCLGSKLIIDTHPIEIIQDFELSGGQIANIALRLGLWALRKDNMPLDLCVQVQDLGLWALRKDNMPLDISMVKRTIMLEQILQGKG